MTFAGESEINLVRADASEIRKWLLHLIRTTGAAQEALVVLLEESPVPEVAAGKFDALQDALRRQVHLLQRANLGDDRIELYERFAKAIRLGSARE